MKNEVPAEAEAAASTYWRLIDEGDYSVARAVRKQALDKHGAHAEQAFRSAASTKKAQR